MTAMAADPDLRTANGPGDEGVAPSLARLDLDDDGAILLAEVVEAQLMLLR